MTNDTNLVMRKIGVKDALAGGIRQIGEWRARARGRAELARLSARELDDIGLSASEVRREISKPFWRP